MKNFIFIGILSFIFFSCANSEKSKELSLPVDTNQAASEITNSVDYGKLPFKNENGNITAVIEIPAGTNHKYEYNYSSHNFECEIRDGKERVVKFLPYVGNYGFIPGTYMDPAIGGDGDALDILVLAESLPQGTIIEITPIATLKLLDGGEEDHKVIAVPLDPKLKLMGINSFTDLSEPTKEIIQCWFSNYKGVGKMEFQEWVGTEETLAEIQKWVKK